MDLKLGEGLLWLLAQVFWGAGAGATKQAEPTSGHCVSPEVGSKRRMLLQTPASDAGSGRSVEKHVLPVLESPARTSCSTSLPAGPDHFLLSINP